LSLPKELRTEQSRWDRLARDPYYAVINDDKNRLDRITDDARDAFIESGLRDILETQRDIRQWLDPDFRPTAAVDFGCGVGRLTLPLALQCGHVTGIDISDTMLVEARRYATDAGVENVNFVSSATYFAQAIEQTLDFVHAFIVFQHIPPRAGMWLADNLIQRLRRGGIGALHFTYGRRASVLRRTVNRLRRHVPGVNALVNVAQRRPAFEPLIPMNSYDLSALLTMLGDRGCRDVHVRLTDHGGHLGAMLIFRRD
jgi:SAM-dependent methyltransferase